MSPADPRPEPGSAPPRHPDAAAGPLTCRDLVGLLVDYLEATLDEDTVALFERHLADCAPCRAYLRTYARSRRLVGEVGQVPMPVEMRDRLRDLLLGRLDARHS
jgi:anti-sigma factor RsiW